MSTTVTDNQKTQADVARTELEDMLLEGVSSPGAGGIVAPFLGLDGVPASALDLYEVVHLAVMRRFTASVFTGFDNVTASYPHVSSTFATKGGTLLVFFSGSARPNATGMFGMDIKVNGVTVGSVEVHGIGTVEHKMLSRAVLVPNIAPGSSHTLGAALRANTSVDSNDRINMVVVELPV